MRKYALRQDGTIRRAAVMAIATMLTVPAFAQPKDAPAELQTLHDRVVRSDAMISGKDAKLAGDRLAEWNLDPLTLKPADRDQVLRVQIFAALGAGNAAAAHVAAKMLLENAEHNEANLQAAYLGVAAAGDAQTAIEILKEQRRGADRDLRKTISTRRRWMRQVGEQAPDVTIRTEDMAEYSTARRRGRVLLLDFWNTLAEPDDAALVGLKNLYEEFRRSRYIEFIGINADAEENVLSAKEAAEKRGLKWEQRYEAQAVNAPLTHEAFSAGRPPWDVLIDSYGYIRAVGAANELAFQYAVRAAVAEAQGEFAIVLPIDRNGNQPKPPGDTLKVSPAKAKKNTSSGDGELTDSTEAEAMLRNARLYMKTGKRTDAKALLEKIVAQYPGTRQAEEAQELLDAVFNP